MKCPKCEHEMIWGGDADCDDDDDFAVESNLSCPKCDCMVIIYWPREKVKSE